MRDYSKFYTPCELSQLLVENCHNLSPRTVIDICAGSWNLLNAAYERWPEVILTGVDINKASKKSIIADGRLYSYNVFNSGIKYDLVLANPPYQYECPSSTILNMIKEKFVNYVFSGYTLSRLECTMLLFNSLLVKPGGILAAIIPNTVITSEKLITFRKYFSNEFTLEKIIYLPDDAFGKSERLHTSIIILRKISSNENTTVYNAARATNEFVANEIYTISSSLVKEGHWANYIPVNKQPKFDQFEIVRNNISSSLLISKADGLAPVIHSSAIAGNYTILHNKLSYFTSELNQSFYTAYGDIAVVRVGKNCGLFARVGQSEVNMLTSDCILLIKPSNNVIGDKIISQLTQKSLEHLKRGVAARYITKKDLESFCGAAIQNKVSFNEFKVV